MNNDELIMENYLLILKSTVEVYVHGTLESSNADTRELLNEYENDKDDTNGSGSYSVKTGWDHI